MGPKSQSPACLHPQHGVGRRSQARGTDGQPLESPECGRRHARGHTEKDAPCLHPGDDAFVVGHRQGDPTQARGHVDDEAEGQQQQGCVRRPRTLPRRAPSPDDWAGNSRIGTTTTADPAAASVAPVRSTCSRRCFCCAASDRVTTGATTTCNVVRGRARSSANRWAAEKRDASAEDRTTPAIQISIAPQRSAGGLIGREAPVPSGPRHEPSQEATCSWPVCPRPAHPPPRVEHRSDEAYDQGRHRPCQPGLGSQLPHDGDRCRLEHTHGGAT